MAAIIKGIPEMVAKLQKILEKLPDEIGRALYQEAQVEMTESKLRCPWEFGVLRASGHVYEPVRNGRSISVTLAYGGVAAPYAVYVHEDMEAFHPRGGQAKYLESVLKESVPHMKGRIARRFDLNRLVA